MGVFLISGSSVSLTTGVETVLTNVGAPGRYQLLADLSNFQNGDAIEFRVKAMITPTGTARVMEYMAYYGLQPTDDIVKFSSVIPNDQSDGNALQFTALQIGGTSRALLWKVLQVEREPSNFLNFSIDAQGRVISSVVQGGFVTVSGSVVASAVQGGVVTVSGTVDAVRGGFVTVSGTVVADVRSLVGVSGTVIADVRSLVGVSGTVVVGTNNDKTGYSLSNPQNFNLIGNISGTIVGNLQGSVQAVQGGFVTVSGAVIADVRSLVGVSGTVVASAVQGLVGVSGTVIASVVQGGFVTVSGTVLASAVQGLVGISGTVISSVVQGGFVTVSGAVIADVRSLVGVSGTVVVGQNNDKTGYSLSSPQNFNLIGNISGTLSTVINLVSGTTGGGGLTAAQVWSYPTRQLTSPQVFDLIGNISGTIVGLNVSVTGVTIDPSSIWGFSTRTLTYPSFPLPPLVNTSNLTVVRGDTWSISLTGLGSLVNHSKVYFSVKRLYTDKDSEAVVQVSDIDGLLIIDGQVAGTAGNASLTITDVNNGNITIIVKAPETAKLDLLKDIYYDVQLVRTDGSVTTLTSGNFTILGDSSRITS